MQSHKVRLGEGGVYAALSLPCEDRDANNLVRDTIKTPTLQHLKHVSVEIYT